MNASASLTSRALRGLSWNYLGTIGRIAATFISQIALARLLGPEPFGLFAYAFLTVMLVGLMAEMGLQLALVQVPTLEPQVVATACGRLLLAGTVAATVVYLLADVIAVQLFANAAAAPVLRAMAPTLVVGVASAAATALLSRDIEFKAIQLAALGSYVLGYLVVGIAAALAGWGVWSLVLAWHVQTLTACAWMIACSPRSLRPGNPFGPLPIAGFGGVVMLTNMINWVIDHGPHAAIGRWLGASMLGQYTLANNLVKVPADHLVRNLQSVLFPLAARAQDNDAGLRRAYLTVLGGVGVLAFPTFTFVAMMATPIVALLLGAKWLAAADVLVPLSLAMVLHAVEAMCGPILGGRGEPRVELRLKLMTVVVTLLVLAVTATWSLTAVGWGVALVFLVRWILMNAAVMQRLGISVGSFAAAMAGPFLLAGITWLVPTGVDAALAAQSINPSAVGLLALTVACTLTALVALLCALPGVVLGPYLLALLDRLFKARPALAHKLGLLRVAELAARAAPQVAGT